jgi:hypothetical protein
MAIHGMLLARRSTAHLISEWMTPVIVFRWKIVQGLYWPVSTSPGRIFGIFRHELTLN